MTNNKNQLTSSRTSSEVPKKAYCFLQSGDFTPKLLRYSQFLAAAYFSYLLLPILCTWRGDPSKINGGAVHNADNASNPSVSWRGQSRGQSAYPRREKFLDF